MRTHLPIAAGGLIVIYLLFQLWQGQQWSAYAASHGCEVVETSDSREWASIGMTGHPRVGASMPREKWRCADGSIHWRDKL